MALHKDFPKSPYEILDPDIRWFPADEALREQGYDKLLPPLVATLRKKVKEWRDSGYDGRLPGYKRRDKRIRRETSKARQEKNFLENQKAGILRVIYAYEIVKRKDLLLTIVTGNLKN